MTTPATAAPWDEDDAISPRAAEFIEQRRFGEWSDADQAALDAWLAESTFHRVAWLRLEAALSYTGHLAEIRTINVGPTLKPNAPDGNAGRRRFLLPLLAAASIVAAAVVGIPFVSALLQPLPERTYSTEVGGRTTLKFADGTVLDLNTDTAVRFRMTGEERTVWLERGEAWFHVAHNEANPFAVVVGKDRITDVGTEFLIRRSPDRMEVALLNGRATLSREGAPVTMLAPGDDAVATPVSMSVTRKTPQELADALAWRQGMLVFRNTRLADAVREINRYNTTKLVIADPSIADLKFTGEIKDDSFKNFLEIAQDMMKLRAERQGKSVLLSRELSGKTQRAAHGRAVSP